MAAVSVLIQVKKFYIEKNAHIPWADIPPLIDNRCLECHYAKYVLHIVECTYTQDDDIPPIHHRYMELYYTE